ncbi:MAG: T9SS type A sorting domain-containing protein [Ignavibacteria bacterium]|jgi:hypothetical protein
MKKIIFFTTIFLMVANILQSQVVNFSLQNSRLDQGFFIYDVVATISSAQQQWKVGPTCIRISFNTIPANALTVKEDNPATNANINLSGNNNYWNMTTTKILHDTAISLNILLKRNVTTYILAPGTYTLGSVRWNVLDSGACINTIIQTFSAIFDTLTPLTYGTQWTKTDNSCTPIGINTRITTKVPRYYQLYQNYPNPFNPSTTIKYDIMKTSDVRIIVYDALGREIETLVNEQLKPGTYEVTWDAANYASGLYFYKIISGEFTQTLKMVLMK